MELTLEQRRALALASARLRASQAAPEVKYDPTEGMSGLEKFAAGTGKALSDTGLGIRQLGAYVGLGDSDALAKEAADRKQRDRALMDTGAGIAGNVAGHLGMALAPGGALKAAGAFANAPKLSAAGGVLLAPQKIRHAATIGAVYGASQPAENIQERLTQTGIGAGATAAFPALSMTYRGAKSAIEPLYEEGQKKILGRLLRTSAGDYADDAMRALQQSRELVPGSMPTAGQAAKSPGIAALERAAAQANPEEYARRYAAQNAARVDALQAIVGNDAQRNAAVVARETQSKALRDAAIQNADYGTTRTAQLEGRLANKQRAVVSALQDEGRFSTGAATQQRLADTWTPVPGLPRAPGRYSLNAERVPEALSAAADAGQLVTQRKAELAFIGRQLDSLKQAGYSPLNIDGLERGITSVMSKPGMRASTVVQRTLDDLKDKLGSLADKRGNISAADLYTVRKELGNTISVHAKDTANWDKRLTAGLERDLQKAIDKQISNAGAGKLWDNYLNKFKELSRPINQMDIAQEIAEKSTNKLTGNLQPNAFARALSDNTAARATGFNRATLENIMEPQQLQMLGNIKDDLAASVFAQNAGRGVGSNTFQNLAQQNLMNSMGVGNLPQLLSRPVQLANYGLRAVYGASNKDMQQMLAQGLLNPQTAAEMMAMATPSQRQALAELMARHTFAPLGMTAPGLLNANQ